MKKLYKIYKSIILESVSPDVITDCVINSKQTNITYNDEKGGKGKGKRTILPMLYGVYKNGELAVRAFQSFGDTKTSNVKWKIFFVKRITSWNPTSFKFNYMAIQKDSDLPNYRLENGEPADDDFIQIIAAFKPNVNNLDNEEKNEI